MWTSSDCFDNFSINNLAHILFQCARKCTWLCQDSGPTQGVSEVSCVRGPSKLLVVRYCVYFNFSVSNLLKYLPNARSGPYGQNWTFLWTNPGIPVWVTVILVVLFFVGVWAVSIDWLTIVKHSSWNDDNLPRRRCGSSAISPNGTLGCSLFLRWD